MGLHDPVKGEAQLILFHIFWDGPVKGTMGGKPRGPFSFMDLYIFLISGIIIQIKLCDFGESIITENIATRENFLENLKFRNLEIKPNNILVNSKSGEVKFLKDFYGEDG